MGKIIKSGKIVVLLGGRFAGRKAVVVKAHEEGNKERKFGHALVAGVARAPLKVTKVMSNKKIQRRLRIKPFVKYVNLNHILPTRYHIANEFDLKPIVTDERVAAGDKRKELRKELKELFEKKYKELPANEGNNNSKTTHVRFLFKKLKF